MNIIQGIDRKLPLEDLAASNHIDVEALLLEMNAIVNSGTKLNIDYIIDENVDEYAREDIL